MNYNEFKDTLVSLIKEQLGASYSVTLETIIKNNDISLDAIAIRNDNLNIAPSLYINHLYGAYEQGEPIENIANHLIELNNSNQLAEDFDTSFLVDFEEAQNNIIYKLINRNKNQKLLSNVPYIEFLDLAVVFYYKVDENYLKDGYILINNDILSRWNISKDDLYSFAKQNTSRMYKIKVTRVFDLIYNRLTDEEKKVFDIREDFPLFVLSNEQVYNGANCLLDTETLSSISEMHESNLYIIPSSIHETLFIPEKDSPIDVDYMTQMVKSVNANELPEHEILSDHVYLFNREEKCLSIAG